jgi:NAD(P)-dependent dehydrogenase (short-subunit alcohol dehydrogenase family)
MKDTASKGAVLAMTRELAMVHAREGIRFNSLCPYVPISTRLALADDQWPDQDSTIDGFPQHPRET